MKAGTNQFHGAFLWIPQTQKWRAPYDVLDIPREDEIINSFETGLGGPLVRDRAWFFASYSEQDTNEVDLLADGAVEDVGFKSEISILKLNLQPSSRHYISLLGVDSPLSKVNINQQSADRFTPCACDLVGEILTGTWGYSLSQSLFLELKAASQENQVLRDALRVRDIGVGANPHSPVGNRFPYIDQGDNLRYNSIAQCLGLGSLKIPRDQANASLSVLGRPRARVRRRLPGHRDEERLLHRPALHGSGIRRHPARRLHDTPVHGRLRSGVCRGDDQHDPDGLPRTASAWATSGRSWAGCGSTTKSRTTISARRPLPCPRWCHASRWSTTSGPTAGCW